MDFSQQIPPDGGWGWMVVIAYAIANIILIPILQSFGLIYKDKFVELGIKATDTSIIFNMFSAIGMGLGLITGPLIRIYGNRKIGFIAGIFLSFGLFLTTWGQSLIHFLITYSTIAAIGFGFAISSFTVSLNSYFKKKRNKAVGIALTLTGLGPVVFPQLISFLLNNYGVSGCMLIISAISLHVIAASLLLQPIEWHMIYVPSAELQPMTQIEALEEPDTVPELLMNESNLSINDDDEFNFPRRMSIDIEAETQSIYGFDALPIRRISDANLSRIGSHGDFSKVRTRTISTTSHENRYRNVLPPIVEPPIKKEIKTKNTLLAQCRKFCKRIVKFFDLDLFRDPIYVNIVIGLSIAVCAEINYSILTPFILNDMKYSTEQIASVMSAIAFTDIVFRFLAPFIGDYLKRSPRFMYMVGVTMLIIARSLLLFATSFRQVMMVGFCHGIARGIRSVYMVLVVPSYVPLERLASATGLQMVFNGICMMTIGPIIGAIRDYTGNYKMGIIFINCISLTTLCLWSTEMILRKIKTKNRKEQQEENVIN